MRAACASKTTSGWQPGTSVHNITPSHLQLSTSSSCPSSATRTHPTTLLQPYKFKTTRSPGRSGLVQLANDSTAGTTLANDEKLEQATGKVSWYKKPCEGFRDLSNVAELEALLKNPEGKITVVDIYAGWCASCKAAFPALCRIPGTSGYSSYFNFCKMNVEAEGVQEFIKSKGIKGIPYIMCFDQQGKDLISFGASFKKMEAVKKNLDTIATSKVQDFVLDPNGFVIVRNSQPV